ncbi:MAG: quinone-interacting membrane-bound oxidoreductase complex subunit QmoC [Candidatus Krumholzibacteriia bacterium]
MSDQQVRVIDANEVAVDDVPDVAPGSATDLTAGSLPPPLAERIEPDLAFIRELRQAGGETLKKCYQCATCSVTCELAPVDRPFPRKEMIWAQWGLKDRLLADPDIFLCYQCNDCSQSCPRGARPGDVLAALRASVYARFAFPSFMGKALGNPNAMLALFLVPVAVLFGLLVLQHAGTAEGFGGRMAGLFTADHVHYHSFLAHGLLEGLFIAGNVFIFLLAGVGFYRYYDNLRRHHGGPTTMGFGAAVTATIKEIVMHRRFTQCGQNRSRSAAHMLVLFGFLGAAATAGLALGFMLVWMARNPGLDFGGIGLANPIKWLGVTSGVALITGSVLMIRRRRLDPDAVGANGFADQLFVWMIFVVAATGMLTWMLRLVETPALAYPIYFVHLVAVFFLLWYMPYSKFSHMIYRALALSWAHQSARVEPRPKL